MNCKRTPIPGPELLNKYVGESELAVRTLFSRARTCSPCIIFFDEVRGSPVFVDALTTTRGKEGGWVVERLLNQPLIELDGSDQRPGIFIIGATNRFGKLLYAPLPSSEDRGLILKALAKGKPIDPSVDLDAIGQMEACKIFSGADIRKLMEEAAMSAVKKVKTQRRLNDETSALLQFASSKYNITKLGQRVSKQYEKKHKLAFDVHRGYCPQTIQPSFTALHQPCAGESFVSRFTQKLVARSYVEESSLSVVLGNSFAPIDSTMFAPTHHHEK
ncbi:hypothetical protein SADUNF_Sadunf19G0112200 [Salix dunnii]|uniref:ATPase AAA-type core domain-containing protein n=1 Tax=Salix dunnii TaxID=1413687 RepID=A0A835J2X7_9ROSI|nr:hypothetical protein SADUNF_Sadunf19G0112200 [Salix dunnii]